MKILFKTLSISLLAFFALSCGNDGIGDDPGTGTGPDSNVNKWIYGRVSEWYLWPEDVAAKYPNYNDDYKTFFRSLLSSNRDDGYDNKSGGHTFYSYIERIPTSRAGEKAAIFEKTHGIDFSLVVYPASTSGYVSSDPVMAVITYVKPGSPAEGAGLVRGDRIFNIGGTNMTYGNYSQLYSRILSDSYGDGNPQVTTIRWYKNGTTQEMGPASITPMRMEDNPVFMYKKVGDGTTGYLLYDQFETGGNGHPYDDALKKAIRSLDGVRNLVVDLRYNPGGYVSSCQLLASMIAPSSKAGSTFIQNIYNDNKGSAKNNFLTLDEMNSSFYGNGEAGHNLNLNRVYIIATESSASASETLIHGLRGAGVEVIHIGETTHGKNVGMSGFKSESDGKNFGSYKYEMWPVTFYIKDGNGNGYSNKGIDPVKFGGISFKELNLDMLMPLGDNSEAYLGAALHHIEYGTFDGYTPVGSRAAARAENVAPTAKVYTPMGFVGMKQVAE